MVTEQVRPKALLMARRKELERASEMMMVPLRRWAKGLDLLAKNSVKKKEMETRKQSARRLKKDLAKARLLESCLPKKDSDSATDSRKDRKDLGRGWETEWFRFQNRRC
jgi:hypothetical protein